MRILDLRPRTVRLMSKFWGPGHAARAGRTTLPGPPHAVARLTGLVTGAFLARRVAARRLTDNGPAMVSVGNLALGGTGKTPVVAALGADLAAMGFRGAVLTRGFGSDLKGPVVVEPGNIRAGDEARVIAAALAESGWPVIQARRRTRGLTHLLENFPDRDVVIIEDGHQTAGLGRHLDVVILDGWTVMEQEGGQVVVPVTGPVFPFGPWRESALGADRAGIWLLETDEPVPPAGTGGQAVVSFQRKLILGNPSGSGPEAPDTGSAALLSGIARPESFEEAVSPLLAVPPVLAVRCGDHASYSRTMMDRIIREAVGAGATFLVTTAKDWVKIRPFRPSGFPVLVADLEIRWGRGPSLPEVVRDRLSGFQRPWTGALADNRGLG